MPKRATIAGRTSRRLLLAVLAFGGLRISEALDLKWRDVDLAAGRLRVGKSKTDAGVRSVDIVPVLRDVLIECKASLGSANPYAYVFPTNTGKRQSDDNLRSRVLHPTIERANAKLENPLPDGLKFHSLRKTFVSILYALGSEMPYVMAQVGHADPKVNLGIYAHVMSREPGERERLRSLVGGAIWTREDPSEAVVMMRSSQQVARKS